MERLIEDFKAVVSAVAKHDLPYVRGRLWDPKTGVACATGLLVANRDHRPLSSALARRGVDALVFPEGSRQAIELSSLTQFEADDILAETYNVPVWQAQFAAAKEDASSALMISAIDGPADLISGGRGNMLVDYVGYLGTRTPAQWADIRRRSEDEYGRIPQLVEGESIASRAVLSAGDPTTGISDLAFAQYWTRAVAFRSLYAAQQSDSRKPRGLWRLFKRVKQDESSEWDTAWLAWGTDLARRGAIEILAQGLGVHREDRQSVLPMLAWKC